MKSIINVIVAGALIAAGLYVFMVIPSLVDFSQVIIRIQDNDQIYRFLVYLPLVLSIFSGILALANIVVRNVTLTIMNLIISLIVAVFLFVDYMGFTNAIVSVGDKLNLIKYVNIGACILLLVEVILFFIKKKPKSATV